jgi:hypothetical protein
MDRRNVLQLLAAAGIAPASFALAAPAKPQAKDLLLRPQDFGAKVDFEDVACFGIAFKASCGDTRGIRADIDIWKYVHTVAIGLGGAFDLGCFFRKRDVSIRDAGTSCVGNRSLDTAGSGDLGVERTDSKQD